MFKLGYTNLHGIDPFLTVSFSPTPDILIEKRDIYNVSQRYDVIMLRHVLEHIREQHATIAQLKKILNPHGIIIIRIPTCSSYAYKHYKNNWIQLDPPRHLVVHSLTSFEKLIRDNGLHINQIIWDSTDFQFTGSELHIKDIPMKDHSGHITKTDVIELRKQAEGLNKQKSGDQFCAIIQQ